MRMMRYTVIILAWALVLTSLAYAASLEKAKTLRSNGLRDEAKKELVGFLFDAASPEDGKAEALLLLGDIALDEKNRDAARENWNKLVTTYPSSPSAVVAKAKLEVLDQVARSSQSTSLTAPQYASGSGGRTEVPDPMQIDVSLGADIDTKGAPRESFDHQPLGKARIYPEVDRFVCDQARVRMLTVKKLSETPTEVVLQAALTLVSDWPLQDVDLTVALVSKDGQVIKHQLWDNLTLGAWSHSYVPPKAEFRIPAPQWKELFASGSAPILRIIVDIQE
jgi:hypothetical protein